MTRCDAGPTTQPPSSRRPINLKKRTEEVPMSITKPQQTDAPPLDPVDTQPSRMRALDFVALWTGLLVLAWSGSLARDGLVAGERAIFEAINSWSDVVYVAIWPFMQYGVF